MKEEQRPETASREDRRVFAWGIVAAVVALLGALAYFHVLQKRFEVPVELPATPTAPTAPRGISPGGSSGQIERCAASDTTGFAVPVLHIDSGRGPDPYMRAVETYDISYGT